MNAKLGGDVCFAVFRRGCPQLECLGREAEPAAAPLLCVRSLSCCGFVSNSSVRAGEAVGAGGCTQVYGHFSVVSRFLLWDAIAESLRHQ